jgi:hypothetical protein
MKTKLHTLPFLLLVTAALLVLPGCNTLPEGAEQGSVTKTVKKLDGSVETITNESDYATFVRAKTDSKPLFEMTCPQTGCIISSLKVNSPDSNKNIAPPPEGLGATVVKGFFGLANSAMDKAAGVAPWYFGADLLKKAFDKANSSVTNIDNSNRSTDNSNRSTTDNSNRSTNTDNSNRSTDNSNRSVNNSNNRNCTSGPAGNGAGTTTGGAGGPSGPATC